MIDTNADRSVRTTANSRAPKAINRKAIVRSATMLAATCRREAEATDDAGEREHLLDVAVVADRCTVK